MALNKSLSGDIEGQCVVGSGRDQQSRAGGRRQLRVRGGYTTVAWTGDLISTKTIDLTTGVPLDDPDVVGA